ncbi:unnamed protein product [Rotaria magnacalcarata]|uniref:Uncharacterized protein n=2 Tax=Rotaria magnacalcarata TaxID=392030 RepID=A0A816WY99_9BILA|nr:unnamed protein product [Rotaria magnacalcarata]
MFSPPITDIVEISNSLDDDFPLQIDTLPVKESVTVTSKTTTATTSADSSSSSTINKLVQNLKRTSQPLYSLISNVETHPTIGKISGHKPLAFNMPIGIESKPASPRLSLNFNTANWSKFRNKFNEQLMLWNKHRHITTSSDIEEYTTFITNNITTAIQEAIPT